MVLGRLFLGERGGVRAWLGSAAALAGVAVLAGPGAVGGVGGGYRALAGTGLVLAGTLSFAAYTIVLRPLSQEFGAVPATAASTVVGAVPYLAAAGTLPGAGLAHLGPAVWAELAFLAARQHGGRPAAVERRRPRRRNHPGQPAALPGARGQRARRGGVPRRAREPW